MSGRPITERVAAGGDRRAVTGRAGTSTFGELDRAARSLADVLLEGRDDLDDDRVAVLAEAGRDFIVAVLACWHAGGIAVPLHPPHPEAELEYVVTDADASVIVTSLAHRADADRLAGRTSMRVVGLDEADAGTAAARSNAAPDRPALMIHTSGTTGRPKGVVHTHASIAAQVDALLEAWGWTADDRILLVLPLNHVHGLVNVTLCALAAGACCEAPGGFDAEHVWSRFASGELTLFMAVPTIYTRLLAAWEQADDATQRAWSDGARRLRLMVSGSAALPVSTLERWRELTGQVLLERYGMTELGMALSNTLTRRVPGHVGEPLPGVETRVVDDNGVDVDDGQSGELLVRGPNVFREYWRRPDCAVVGVDDPEWGERVAAAVVRRPGADADADTLRTWGKQRLAVAKVPSRYVFVDELPRNTLGKVVKPEMKTLFE